MKKLLVLSFLFLLPFISFCQNSDDVVMPLGDGNYIVSRQGATGFTSLGKLRKQCYEIANEFAKKNNSTAEVLSVNETEAHPLGGFPNVDLKFRLVKKSQVLSDSTHTTITVSAGHSANGEMTDEQITIKNPKQNTSDKNDKLDRLEKLGKLYKDGVLTKEEFEIEKKKILDEK
jgi:hypothetical protein